MMKSPKMDPELVASQKKQAAAAERREETARSAASASIRAFLKGGRRSLFSRSTAPQFRDDEKEARLG